MFTDLACCPYIRGLLPEIVILTLIFITLHITKLYNIHWIDDMYTSIKQRGIFFSCFECLVRQTLQFRDLKSTLRIQG